MHFSLKTKLVVATCAAGFSMVLAASTQAQVLSESQRKNPWFVDGHQSITEKISTRMGVRAKNVILFVGDGMGVSTLTAARILEGQLNGMPGEENFLSFERFPYTALVKTYNVDAQTPDSAGTMTAMISGIKTDVGVIGVDEDIERGNCESTFGNEVVSAIELAELKGM